MLGFDKATYLSLPSKYISPERLSNSLWGSGVLLFIGFMNIVSILHYSFIEFIILLDTFLVITLLNAKNIWFDRFHLASSLIYYLLLLVQELLVIICLGVNSPLIVNESFSMNWPMFSLRYNCKIIIKKLITFSRAL